MTEKPAAFRTGIGMGCVGSLSRHDAADAIRFDDPSMVFPAPVQPPAPAPSPRIDPREEKNAMPPSDAVRAQVRADFEAADQKQQQLARDREEARFDAAEANKVDAFARRLRQPLGKSDNEPLTEQERAHARRKLGLSRGEFNQ